MRELPSGTVTFLLTDIEGSTRLLRENRSTYGEILDEHRRILRAAFEKNEGREIDTQGDSFLVAFRTARSAVAAAVDAQRELAAHAWPGGVEPKVRMGMHTGEPSVSGERYVGLAVHRAARVCAAAHGGQMLLSSTTADLVADELPPETGLRDLGEHRLKDFDRPERIFQLVAEGLPADFPSLRTSQADAVPVAAARPVPTPVGAWRGLDRRQRRWLLAAVGLLAASALVLAIASRDSTDRSGVPSGSVAVIDLATNRVVGSIPLGGSAGALAEFEGAVWAALTRDRTLARIDPERREVTKRIGLGIAPYSLAPTENGLWIAGGFDSTVVRLLPRTHEVTPLPGFDVPVDGYPVIAANENGLWIGENDRVGLRRFDAERLHDVPLDGRSLTPEAIAAGGTEVWIVERFDQAVARLDAETGADRGEIAFGAPVVSPGAATFHEPLSEALLDEHGLWVTDAVEGKIWRIQPAQGSIQATINVGRGARPIASGGGSIWVANRADGTVSRIDPGTDRVVATIKVGEEVGGVAVAAESVWVTVP